MAMNMKKMLKSYEKHQKAGDFWSIPIGQTVALIHPQCRPNDKWEPTEGVNFVEIGVHYNVGRENSMIISLDPAANPIIEHPFVKKFLKKKNKKLTGEDPLAKAIESGAMTDDEADGSRRQFRFLWGITPLRHRASKDDKWTELPGKPSVAIVGKTVFEGIMDLFSELGDITDMDGATLVVISRTGKGKTDTRYKITADFKTVRRPLSVPQKLRRAIEEAMKEGGDCDLFKIVAGMIKTPDEVEALISGVKIEDEPEEDEDEPEEDENEPEEPEEDEDEPEEDENEPEEDEEDEDEPEEDENEPEEDENEPEEDEDNGWETKPKKRGRPAKTKKEDDLDDLDAEIERISKLKSKIKKNKNKTK